MLDIESEALDVAEARVRRQSIDNVTTICGDYNALFTTPGETGQFLRDRLGGAAVDLVLLHHSLYYADAGTWQALVEHLFRIVQQKIFKVSCKICSSVECI